MKKVLTTALILGQLLSPLLPAAAPEPQPQDARQEETSAVKDRLSSSLFFRGELADKMIEAGMAGRFVDLQGIETNAGAKSALLAWIQKNPAKAAGIYLNLKGGGGGFHESIETRETTWEINPSFMAAIKALNDAAGNASVSRETLELAARRLYAGPQADEGGGEVVAGGRAGGSGFFSINYADYRLNKAGLDLEISRAGAWLEGVRASGADPEIKGPYSTAFSRYSDFVVAAAALKSRTAVTAQESGRLEGMRVKLRSAMAALTLRARIISLTAAKSALERSGREPGAKELLLSLSRVSTGLEVLVGRVEAGGVGLAELEALLNSAENDFAALYLRYSAYSGLLGLKSRAESGGFSCFYDYVIYSYLAAFFPEAAYPAARAGLAADAGVLDAALLRAGAGDLASALSGLEVQRLESAAGMVRSAAAFNRGAQFFLWGLLFRPVEYKISVSGGRAVFRPAFTFFEVAGRKWR